MSKNVRLREPLTASPTLEYLNQRMAAGWKLVALEWEKEGEGEVSATPETGVPMKAEEIPYGLQVSSDCVRRAKSYGEL